MAGEQSLEFPTQVSTRVEPVPPTAIEVFEDIYAKEFLNDQKRFNESDSPLTRYRVLKEVLRANEFTSQKFDNNELRALSNHMLQTQKLTWPFKEWIRTRNLEWERKILPRNAYRLYALGKRASNLS